MESQQGVERVRCECRRGASHATSGEREVAATRLDTESPPPSATPTVPATRPARDHDRTASYLQVVVEKHGRGQAGAGGQGDGGAPALRLPHASSPRHVRSECGRVRSASPERVEVYRFERVGGVLVARGGRAAGVEARAAGVARAARRAGAEALGAARLAWRLPVGGALLAARAALEAARDVAAGAAALVSDLALKPALGVAYGALVQPLLVFVGQTLAGAREAARPLCAALHEAAGAAARVLRAVRLVDVHVSLACPHHRPPHPHPHAHRTHTDTDVEQQDLHTDR